MSRTRMSNLIFVFELCPLIKIFTSFLEHNFATVCNIFMILGRIIEQVIAECHVQERQLCISPFVNHVP